MPRGQTDYCLIYPIILHQMVDRTKIVWSEPLNCCLLPETDTLYLLLSIHCCQTSELMR